MNKSKVENGEVIDKIREKINGIEGFDYSGTTEDIIQDIQVALNQQRELLEKDCPCKPIHAGTCSRYGVGKTLENYNKSKLPIPNEGEKI